VGLPHFEVSPVVNATVQPGLIALGKSVGGGLPFAAFGGSEECMDAVVSGRVLHVGTYNGNPLCMAAARAVLGEIGTPEETARVNERNCRFATDCHAALAMCGTPAHVAQFGATGCVTFDLAFAQWTWGVNRGVLLPPGLDEQWLMSVALTPTCVALDVFTRFLDTVLNPSKIDDND
jgi:glutamate-1-semialdehyde 2,1-aminomutase